MGGETVGSERIEGETNLRWRRSHEEEDELGGAGALADASGTGREGEVAALARGGRRATEGAGAPGSEMGQGREPERMKDELEPSVREENYDETRMGRAARSRVQPRRRSFLLRRASRRRWPRLHAPLLSRRPSRAGAAPLRPSRGLPPPEILGLRLCLFQKKIASLPSDSRRPPPAEQKTSPAAPVVPSSCGSYPARAMRLPNSTAGVATALRSRRTVMYPTSVGLESRRRWLFLRPPGRGSQFRRSCGWSHR
ncbi:hypothetical protein BRADI_2g22108v3 [Brachypodium distachyon]|uniref:Uncharacterized protein n=1 Tax=Brachypodium distachyon TaxID=15368 RepID=A0A0Q3MNI8_BRADI|nr:hypothetical protein BRADI_2g22108v3 [Brachypodium distachyon]